jgi:hypothetical protein
MLFTERELCSMTEICNAHLLKSQTLSSGNPGKTTEINSGKATQDQEKTYCRCERLCHRSFHVAVNKRVVITVFSWPSVLAEPGIFFDEFGTKELCSKCRA